MTLVRLSCHPWKSGSKTTSASLGGLLCFLDFRVLVFDRCVSVMCFCPVLSERQGKDPGSDWNHLVRFWDRLPRSSLEMIQSYYSRGRKNHLSFHPFLQKGNRGPEWSVKMLARDFKEIICNQILSLQPLPSAPSPGIYSQCPEVPAPPRCISSQDPREGPRLCRRRSLHP